MYSPARRYFRNDHELAHTTRGHESQPQKRRQEDELRKIAEQEEDAQRRIQELEDLQTITSDSYKTIEEEIESKGKKTKKLHEAYERCLVDIKDLERDWTSEREDLLDVIRALTREIKLKNLVAEKMKVIAVLEKERQSMQKLHRQYQKDAMDQDAMEAEYASRVQRVNGPAPACPSLPPRPRPCCCPSRNSPSRTHLG